MESSFRTGFWRLADPKISITSAASMAIGASLAADHPSYSWPWLVVLGVAMFCVEVAKNAWGDVYDYDSGTDLAVRPEDRTNFSGGKRVLVDKILSRGQTWAIAFGFGLAGVALGAGMVFFREPQVLWIGALGFVLGWSYHGPPLRFAYRGLGEMDVVLCYGPLIAVATYVLMTGEYNWEVVWLSMPLGLLIAAFLWVNEFPDYEADRGADKRNLVVQLGKPVAARVLPFIYLAAFGWLCVLPFVTALPPAIVLGLIAMPAAALASYWTMADPQTFHRRKPAQPAALFAFVLYSMGASIGVIAGE